jgi:hypothetical protein
MVVDYLAMSSENFGRVAQAFDLAGITNTLGAPSFAPFAKGGYHERRQLRSYATRFRNEIFVQPSFTFTGPASPRR